ncbi:MAG: hypothetical protein GY913_05640 [Proteobacteria bacterium]|nr:hypothetical protein [Pseudomonadota bacterium]MCP4916386.1 hypothetical protein [Pseudomonadota bacterium]
MTALLALFSLNANAADLEVDSGNRMYAHGRASVAVPAGARGIATPIGVAVGTEFEHGTTLGLRILGMNEPPKSFIGDPATPAAGTMIDWAYHKQITANMDMYPTASIGFAVAQNDNGYNIVLPLAETGIGMRMQTKPGEAGSFYVAPELGVIPFIGAPYAALNVGGTFGS